MQIKRRPTALVMAFCYGVWDLFIKPIWTLDVEQYAQREQLTITSLGIGRVTAWFNGLVAYVPSSFGLGFVTGALIFAYWDAIAAAVNTHILRREPKPLIEPAAEIRAWTGEISAFFEPSDSRTSKLFIRVINWGTVPFRVSDLKGLITLSHDDGNGKKVVTELPPPMMGDPKEWTRLVEPGYIMMLDIVQLLPAHVARLLPDMFSWRTRPYFNFDNLAIILEEPGGVTKRLKLCDSLRLTSGEWCVRYDQATRMFKTDADREDFKAAMDAVTKRLGL